MEKEKLVALLRRDAVKLWLPPFTNTDHTRGSVPQEFIEKYSKEGGWPGDLLCDYVEILRVRAVNRSLANEKHKQQGIATVYVRQSSSLDAEAIPVEIDIKEQTEVLHDKISGGLGIGGLFRLIAAGKLLETGRSLDGQNVMHNSEILVIEEGKTGKGSQEMEWQESVHKTKDAAERLANRKLDSPGGQGLQVTDQFGKSLDLPESEQRGLTIAMTLQERGRGVLKKGEYGRALVFFLEADSQFQLCSKTILDCTDNYPILCMDIVWCYLLLKSVACLPDAERRLKTSEEGFRKSYGSNLERVATFRESTELERSLLVRLKLLQGILAYYHKDRARAKELLSEVDTTIKELDVDDTKLAQVMSMGYSNQESRIALRASKGNISKAVEHVLKMKEDKKKMKEEAKKRDLSDWLGNTSEGRPVQMDHYQSLLDMGFQKNKVKEALQQSNNDINTALELLRIKQFSTQSSCTSGSGSSDTDGGSSSDSSALSDAVAQLVGMGFTEEKVRSALDGSSGLVQKALELLVNVNQNSPQESAEARKDVEAYAELAEDIGGDELDHLDITFVEESVLLHEYMALINIQGQNTRSS